MKERRNTISIVIPNWNGSHLLKRYLPEVLKKSEGAEIIVVDDASTDDSVDILKHQFPSIRVIPKKRHEGFASTVNVGVIASHGDIVMLLNTDVVPEKGFLKPLISHFIDPSVFAVGCMDKSMEHGNVVLRGRGLAEWKKGFFIHWRGEVNKSDTVWVSGGSGAFRKNIWQTLGGMDPLFNPFYWEDIDLSYRALKAGYKILFEPKSIVIHHHEEGKIRQVYSPHQVNRIAYRNQFIFIWKNLTDRNIIVMHALFTPVRLVQGMIQGDFSMIIGYIQALFLLPNIMVSRLVLSRMQKKTDSEVV